MTYRELYESAINKLEKSEITLGEFERMIKPLNAEVATDINVGDKDTISRKAAIDALWKAMYEYEDKTEKQFQESDELDIGDWLLHRIFVQNMSDIDRQTILNLPPAQPERIKGHWVDDCTYMGIQCSACGKSLQDYIHATEYAELMEVPKFCPNCGADMREVTT